MPSEARSNEGIEVLVHASGQVQAVQLRRAGPAVEPEPVPGPGDARLRSWFEVAVSLAVVGFVGWFIVDSFHTLLEAPGWVPFTALAAAAMCGFLWFRYASWSRRVKLLGIVLVVLAVGAPLASYCT